MNEMRLRFRVAADVADLLFAMGGQGADRNDADLQAGEEGVDQLLAIAHLEQDPIGRTQSEAPECGRASIGHRVEFCEGRLLRWSGQRYALAAPGKGFPEGTDQRLVGEDTLVHVALDVRRRHVNNAWNLLTNHIWSSPFRWSSLARLVLLEVQARPRSGCRAPSRSAP